jgi:hypothetical protein
MKYPVVQGEGALEPHDHVTGKSGYAANEPRTLRALTHRTRKGYVGVVADVGLIRRNSLEASKSVPAWNLRSPNTLGEAPDFEAAPSGSPPHLNAGAGKPARAPPGGTVARHVTRPGPQPVPSRLWGQPSQVDPVSYQAWLNAPGAPMHALTNAGEHAR